VTGVSEQNLPGIGRSYAVTGIDGARVTVVVHHSGRRDLYVYGTDGSADPTVLSLTDDQARRLGAVLGGAYFQPTIVSEVEAVIGELLIDWVTIRPESPGAGRSIAELEIRQRTGMTVVAVLRGDETILSPEPTSLVLAGDRLVVIGRREDLARFLAHVVA
jgi:TrkA domain protein